MKKYLKVIAVALVIAIFAAFAACGNTSKGTLTMGTNAAFPPYEFMGEDGSITGIDAEIAKAVCDKLGYELEIKDMEFDSLISAVAGGSIDFVLAGLTKNAEREEKVNFSSTYAKGVQVVIVPENSKIASVDDLKGKKIGVQSGTTGDIYCTDDFGQANVKQYNNGSLAVQALKNKQVDCVIIDNEPAKSFVAANEGLKILDTEYVEEEYAAAFAKENTELLENFNAALAELQADGTVDTIIAKYITAE